MPAPGGSRSPLEPREILGGLVIVRVVVAALAHQRPTGQLWRGRLQAGVGGSRQGTREPPALADRLLHEAPSRPKAPARAERASASSSPPIAVIEGDGRVTASPPSDLSGPAAAELPGPPGFTCPPRGVLAIVGYP